MTLPTLQRLGCAALAAVALSPAVALASRLTNVSVRSSTGSDSATLIVGFSISGSGTKQMLIRGVGPTLADYGVAHPVGDPAIELFGETGSLATNDNWGGGSTLHAAFDAVGAFGLAADSKDAALYPRLLPGGYTVHLTTPAPGVALVEAYDADGSASTAQLSNVSARSTAGTGSDVLTIGFSITGPDRKTVLLRAVGPTLKNYGVTGWLADPQLTLYSAAGTALATNDDWWTSAGWSEAFTAVGAFNLVPGSIDSVLLVNLAPGNYTAQAKGANGATGVGLIEVYDVPSPPPTSVVLTPVENVRASLPATDDPPGTTIVRPKVLTQATPTYPFTMRRAGITGDVLVDFLVNTDGTVADPIALHATDTSFADSAVAAVARWTFTPGTRNGLPAVFHFQVPIIYLLNG